MSNADSPANPKAAIPPEVVAEKIKTILSDLLEIDPSDVQDHTRLEDDLGADSLVYLELFEEVKDEFNLDLDLHEVGSYATSHQISTVGELIQLVTRFLQEGGKLPQALGREPRGSA